MPRRPLNPLPLHAYPDDPWRLVERRLGDAPMARTETLFTVANGHLGLRGNHEEGRPAYEHGTLVAGFHETWPIQHAEQAYGLAQVGQTVVDVPDAKIIKLYVDDEPLFLPTAHLLHYERVLDFRTGTVARSLVWETPSGKRVAVRSARLASLRYRHLAAFTYEIRVLSGDAPLVISSQLVNREDAGAPDEQPGEFDPRVRKMPRRVLDNALHEVRGERLLYGYRTARSGMTLGCGVDHRLETDCHHEVLTGCDEDVGKVTYIIEAKPDVPVRLTKFASYHSSRSVPPGELVDRAGRVLRRAMSTGYDHIAGEQEAILEDFWERADVRVDGPPRVQQAVRWNLFQLFQASARAEGSGIPAKGLSGHGYEGHYFWDIEIFVQPFLCYTEPRIAKNLLRFRASMLNHARRRAGELSQVGALFPWRTINGKEASAYYQAGTAQYHLNGDIIYALKHYVEVTGDSSILGDVGAEMAVETARLWTDLGFYGDDGAFHLFTVTGPDEYTTVVNDNAFTNLIARLNLNYAASVVDWLRQEHPERYEVLCHDVGLDHSEVGVWRRAADAMHLPYDEERGINPQDAQFLQRKRWDFEGTPPEHYPLLLHYHPLVIYRHQVLKQADVVLAMFLLGNEFTAQQKRCNYDYYDPLTTSDSSLSPPVHSIIAAELGKDDSAMEHFERALFMDLYDVAENTAHGIHVASTGGVWMALVHGFGGLRDYDGALSFDPRLPPECHRLAFPLTVRGQRLDVEVDHERISLAVREGPDLDVTVQGQKLSLTAGKAATLPLHTRGGDHGAA